MNFRKYSLRKYRLMRERLIYKGRKEALKLYSKRLKFLEKEFENRLEYFWMFFKKQNEDPVRIIDKLQLILDKKEKHLDYLIDLKEDERANLREFFEKAKSETFKLDASARIIGSISELNQLEQDYRGNSRKKIRSLK